MLKIVVMIVSFFCEGDANSTNSYDDCEDDDEIMINLPPTNTHNLWSRSWPLRHPREHERMPSAI